MADMNPRKRPASMEGGLPAHASFFEVADPTMEGRHEEPSLPLPKAFIKRFHSYLSHSLTLEAPNGQVWKARLEADSEKQLRITAGWKDLADYMNVQSGDLLIFDLVSKGHFQVYIYEGEDWCEKDMYITKKHESLTNNTYPPRGLATVENVKQQRPDTCKAYAGPNHANGKYSMALQQKEAVHTQKRHAVLNNDNGTKLKTQTKEAEAAHTRKAQSRDEVMHIRKGRVTSNSENGTESTSISQTQNTQTCKAHTTFKRGHDIGSMEHADLQQKEEINPTYKAHDGAHGTGPCNTHGGLNINGIHGSLHIVPQLPHAGWSHGGRPNLSAKMHLTLNNFRKLCQHFHKETQEAFKKAIAFSSNNPFTIIVMIHSNVCRGFKVALPRPFAEQNLGAEPEHVALIDADNKAWSVTWLGYNNPNTSFSGGWKHFATDHRLQCGDICIFERANTKALNTFKVHIFKVNTKDAAAIQRTIPAKFSNVIARDFTRL